MKTDHMVGTESETANQAQWVTENNIIYLEGVGTIAKVYRDVSGDHAALIVTAVNSHTANLARIALLERLLNRVLVAMRDPDDDGPFDMDMLECDIDAALKGE